MRNQRFVRIVAIIVVIGMVLTIAISVLAALL
jgi:hypothetical protein